MYSKLFNVSIDNINNFIRAKSNKTGPKKIVTFLHSVLFDFLMFTFIALDDIFSYFILLLISMAGLCKN